jgi:hypothetical protein
MELTPAEAEAIAFEFLMSDLAIPEEDQDWFAPLTSRLIGETWYVVEIGVEGLPDKWVLQVYDTQECDPNYTFNSPLKATGSDIGLEEVPEQIAKILATERSVGVLA